MSALQLLTALLFCLIPSLHAQEDSGFNELDRDARQASKEDASSGTEDDYRKAQRQMLQEFQSGERQEAQEYRQLSQQMQQQYDQMLRQMSEEREKLRRNVVSQWTEFHESTNKEWVDYSPKADAVSKVDFEKGTVQVEALVPVEEVKGQDGAVDQGKLREIAKEKLAKQAKQALAQTDAQKTPVLQGQLKAPGGAAVTEKNVEQVVKKDLAPKIQVEEKPVVAQDGKPRIKVKVTIAMVPEHLKVRAQRVQPRVEEVAAKYGLDPALVFAVIHTESFFNPRARSQAPAFGLMQLMPKTAALEAYKYLNKKERILTPDELYDPDNNILLGATYLHMLQTAHFGKVKNADNQRALMIAAYNCGPGCVRRVLDGRDADSLTNQELRALIDRKAPQETQAYVPHVEGRIGLYRSL